MKLKIEEILAISSGTISTLTGYKDYKSIDRIQKKFTQFVIGIIASAPNEFNNWNEAWVRFEKVYNNKNKKFSEWCENPSTLQPV